MNASTRAAKREDGSCAFILVFGLLFSAFAIFHQDLSFAKQTQRSLKLLLLISVNTHDFLVNQPLNQKPETTFLQRKALIRI